ncbi:hypothetical protein FALCPG4_002639 [Fusarium falciforme]
MAPTESNSDRTWLFQEGTYLCASGESRIQVSSCALQHITSRVVCLMDRNGTSTFVESTHAPLQSGSNHDKQGHSHSRSGSGDGGFSIDGPFRTSYGACSQWAR